MAAKYTERTAAKQAGNRPADYDGRNHESPGLFDRRESEQEHGGGQAFIFVFRLPAVAGGMCAKATP